MSSKFLHHVLNCGIWPRRHHPGFPNLARQHQPRQFDLMPGVEPESLPRLRCTGIFCEFLSYQMPKGRIYWADCKCSFLLACSWEMFYLRTWKSCKTAFSGGLAWHKAWGHSSHKSESRHVENCCKLKCPYLLQAQLRKAVKQNAKPCSLHSKDNDNILRAIRASENMCQQCANKIQQ